MSLDITEEEWDEAWREFWADMQEFPEDMWELVPKKLARNRDPDEEMDEIVEHLAGEPTMLPQDAIRMLSHYQRLVLVYLLMTKYMQRAKPHPTLAVVMELIGGTMNEMQGVLRREFKGKPEEAKLEYIM